MAVFESSIHIDAPTDRVYDIITDLHGAQERIEGIKALEVLTDGEFGVGTRFRETRVMFGKEATEEMEVTEVNPGKSYATGAESCGCKYHSVIGVEPDGEGSRLTMSMQATPMTLVGKVMSGVMSLMMKRVIRKCFEADLSDIKRAAESDAS